MKKERERRETDCNVKRKRISREIYNEKEEGRERERTCKV